MKKLQVNGKVEFLGMEIPVIEGGFGEDKRCLTDKSISEIHQMKNIHIRELINRNISRFKESIDFIDLKDVAMNDNNLLSKLGYSNMQISKARNMYILSERGYAKLIKIMDNDLAWEIHDKLMDEYFVMKEVLNSNEQLKAMALLKATEGKSIEEKLSGITAYTNIRIEEETKPLITKIEEDKPMVEFSNSVAQSSDSIDIGTFAKLIKDEGIKFGRNKLFDWLRINGYLMKNNQPYQKYIDNNYFEVIEQPYKTPYGEKIGIKTLVTGVGQIKLTEKIRKEVNK